MALDAALMARARRTGESVLRVYSWSGPVLSLGRNQCAVSLYDDTLLRDAGIGVVRRPTGGRALLHHREVTYSVTAPCPDGERLRATYNRINTLLVYALTSMGVPVTLAQHVGRLAPPGALPCFAEPAVGELVIGTQKLVGSAQWRDRGALLQHGSIIIDDDQSRIPSLLRYPESIRPVPPPATLRAALGRGASSAEIAAALFSALRTTIDRHATTLIEDSQLLSDTAAAESQFRDDAWTWRR